MAWIYKNIKNTKKKHKKLLFRGKIGFFNIKKEFMINSNNEEETNINNSKSNTVIPLIKSVLS